MSMARAFSALSRLSYALLYVFWETMSRVFMMGLFLNVIIRQTSRV